MQSIQDWSTDLFDFKANALSNWIVPIDNFETCNIPEAS